MHEESLKGLSFAKLCFTIKNKEKTCETFPFYGYENRMKELKQT